jgi:hypothetical protein
VKSNFGGLVVEAASLGQPLIVTRLALSFG